MVTDSIREEAIVEINNVYLQAERPEPFRELMGWSERWSATLRLIYLHFRDRPKLAKIVTQLCRKLSRDENWYAHDEEQNCALRRRLPTLRELALLFSAILEFLEQYAIPDPSDEMVHDLHAAWLSGEKSKALSDTRPVATAERVFQRRVMNHHLSRHIKATEVVTTLDRVFGFIYLAVVSERVGYVIRNRRVNPINPTRQQSA